MLIISIHASVKEATIILHWRWKTLLRFQSTPPWRRRQFSDVSSICFIVFQSTPPWRRRQLCPSGNVISSSFQSTPPWRRRLDVTHLTTEISDFNPRLREGGDNSDKGKKVNKDISIHASVKEATEMDRISSTYRQISIHASVKEATCSPSFSFFPKFISIHASVKEATGLIFL